MYFNNAADKKRHFWPALLWQLRPENCHRSLLAYTLYNSLNLYPDGTLTVSHEYMHQNIALTGQIHLSASHTTRIWSTRLGVQKWTWARGRPGSATVNATTGHGATPATFTATASELRTIKLDFESYFEGPMHLISL